MNVIEMILTARYLGSWKYNPAIQAVYGDSRGTKFDGVDEPSEPLHAELGVGPAQCENGNVAMTPTGVAKYAKTGEHESTDTRLVLKFMHAMWHWHISTTSWWSRTLNLRKSTSSEIISGES